jgi:hypothetical protein
MIDTHCPNCGSDGRMASLHLISLYACTNRACGKEFWVDIDANNDTEPAKNERTCAVCDQPVSNWRSDRCNDHDAAGRHDDAHVSPDVVRYSNPIDHDHDCTSWGCTQPATVSHHGERYCTEHARIHGVPDVLINHDDPETPTKEIPPDARPRHAITPAFLDEMSNEEPRMPHEPHIGRGDDRPSHHEPRCEDCGDGMVHAREPETIIDHDGTMHAPHENEPTHESDAWECHNENCLPYVVPEHHENDTDNPDAYDNDGWQEHAWT